MTTPGGGGNEIDFVTRIVPSGDEEQVARGVGERAAQAYAQGVESGPVPTLKPLETGDLYSQLDSTLDRMEERVRSAARNIGLSLQEGVTSGTPKLFGNDLVAEMERYQVAMESYGGNVKSTFVGDFARALENDTRLLSQGYDHLNEVIGNGNRQWALNEEGRTFLARAGEPTGTGDTSGYFKDSTFPVPPRGQGISTESYAPGDLDKVRAAGQAAISRVVLEDSTYAFENGSFFRTSASGSVLRAKGEVTDPELMERLQTAVVGQLQAAEGPIVRQYLEEIGSRSTLFQETGINPGRTYQQSGGELSGTELQGIVQESGTGIQGLSNAIETLVAIGAQAPEVLTRLSDALSIALHSETEYTSAIEQGAAASREAGLAQVQSAERFSALQIDSSLGGGGRIPPRPPTALGGASETGGEGGDDYFLRMQQIRNEAAQKAAQAEQDIAARLERTRATLLGPETDPDFYRAGQVTSRNAQARQSQAEQTYQPNLAASESIQQLQTAFDTAENVRRLLGETADGLTQVTVQAPRLASSEEETAATLEQVGTTARLLLSPAEQMRQKLLAANASVDDVDKAMKGLSLSTERGTLGSLARISDSDFLPNGKINAPTQEELSRLGSNIGGNPAAVTPSGEVAIFDQSRQIQELITQEEALARIEQEATAAAEAEARANDLLAQSYLTMSKAQLQVIAAARELEKVKGGDNPDPLRIAQANLSLQDAQKRAASEESASSAQQRGFLGSAFHAAGFGGGGLGGGDDNQSGANAFKRISSDSGEFLGAIARYQAAYAIIFGLSQGFESALKNELALQSAMIDFAKAADVATDSGNKYVNTLGDIGAQAGLSTAASVQAATKGIFAFGDEVTKNPDGSNNTASAIGVGQESTRATAVASVITGQTDAATAQTELIAATRGFNLTADDQTRVLDAATNAFHNYGGEIDGILQALPTVSQQARQAGLSIEATSNLISLLETRSGATGASAGTQLARILESVDKPAFSQALQGVGVDVTQNQAGQIDQLAGKWSTLTQAQQDNFTRLAVGSRGAASFLAIVQEGNGLLDANKKSYENAGSATDLYNEKLHTVGGLLREIGGDFQSIGHDLTDTGLLDILGAALEIIHPLLRGFDDAVRVVDALNSATGGWLIPLAEVATVLAFIGRQLERNAIAQATVTAETEGEAEADAAAAITGGSRGISRFVPGFLRGAPLAEGEETATTVSRTGLAGLGGALLGPAGAVIGVVALTAAIGGLVEASKAEKSAKEEAARATAQLATASTADEYRSAASALGTAASNQRKANSGLFGSFVSSGNDQARVGELEANKRYATDTANALEAEQQRLSAAGGDLGTYFGTTADGTRDIASGLAAMQAAGVPAVHALALLREAIDGVAGAGDKGAKSGVTDSVATVASLTTAVSRAVGGISVPDGVQGAGGRNQTGGLLTNAADTRQGFQGGSDLIGSIAQGRIQDLLKNFDQGKVKKAIQDALDADHVQPGELIDTKTQGDINQSVFKALGLDKLFSGDALTAAKKNVSDALTSNFGNLSSAVPLAGLNQGEYNTLINGDSANGKQGILAYQDSLATQDNPLQIDSSLPRLQASVQTLQAYLAAGKANGLDIPIELIEKLNKDQADYVTAKVAQLERLRQAFDSRNTNPTAIAANDLSRTRQEVEVALKANDPTALLQILDGASNATVAAIKKSLDFQYAVAKAAYDAAEKTYEEAEAYFNSLPSGDPARHLPDQKPVAPSSSAVDKAKAARDTFNSVNSQRVPTTDATTAANDALAQEVAQINARHQAGDAVGAARDTLDAARATLAGAKTATDRATAERQLKDAQYAYDQALGSYAQAVNAANVRPGDPVSQAASNLDKARVALSEESRGTTAFYTALAAYHDAQYAYQQAILDHQHQLRLLGIDQTNPVAIANEDLRSARAKLANDRANGTGDITADQVAVQSANSKAQAAAFDQRFQDIQTAHQLGTLSDTAYLAYLNSEHERLSKIANRTRQQTDELNQIDGAIKAAADALDGQFNLGDIKVPTPYEARRYITASGQGHTYNSSTTTNTNSFDFTGLDKSEIIALLQNVLGPQAISTTSTQPRK